MSYRFPSMGEAERILAANRPRFKNHPNVLAIGVGIRDGQLKFLVTVNSIEAAGEFRAIGELDGIPLSIEVAIPQAAGKSSSRNSSAEPIECSAL